MCKFCWWYGDGYCGNFGLEMYKHPVNELQMHCIWLDWFLDRGYIPENCKLCKHCKRIFNGNPYLPDYYGCFNSDSFVSPTARPLVLDDRLLGTCDKGCFELSESALLAMFDDYF